jgi:hypothetical protein
MRPHDPAEQAQRPALPGVCSLTGLPYRIAHPRRTTRLSRGSLWRAPRSALSDRQHKTEEEIRHASEELALLERKLMLLERITRFPLTVLFALVSAVSPLLGAHWTVPAGSAAATAVLSALGVRRR